MLARLVLTLFTVGKSRYGVAENVCDVGFDAMCGVYVVFLYKKITFFNPPHSMFYRWCAWVMDVMEIL